MEGRSFRPVLQRVGGFRQQKRKAVFSVCPVGDSKAWICTRVPSLELIDYQGTVHRVVKLRFVTAMFGGVLNLKPVFAGVSEVFQVEENDETTVLAKFSDCDIEGIHTSSNNLFVILKVCGGPIPGWRELLRLSDTGEVLQCLNVNSQGDLLLHRPRLISSFSDGTLCILDKGTLKTLNMEGDRIIRESLLPRDVDEIWNISCDNHRNVILSCGLQGLVKVISETGVNLQTYNMKESLSDGIISVWGAAADDQDRLWIVTYSGDVLVANYIE